MPFHVLIRLSSPSSPIQMRIPLDPLALYSFDESIMDNSSYMNVCSLGVVDGGYLGAVDGTCAGVGDGFFYDGCGTISHGSHSTTMIDSHW